MRLLLWLITIAQVTVGQSYSLNSVQLGEYTQGYGYEVSTAAVTKDFVYVSFAKQSYNPQLGYYEVQYSLVSVSLANPSVQQIIFQNGNYEYDFKQLRAVNDTLLVAKSYSGLYLVHLNQPSTVSPIVTGVSVDSFTVAGPMIAYMRYDYPQQLHVYDTVANYALNPIDLQLARVQDTVMSELLYDQVEDVLFLAGSYVRRMTVFQQFVAQLSQQYPAITADTETSEFGQQVSLTNCQKYRDVHFCIEYTDIYNVMVWVMDVHGNVRNTFGIYGLSSLDFRSCVVSEKLDQMACNMDQYGPSYYVNGYMIVYGITYDSQMDQYSMLVQNYLYSDPSWYGQYSSVSGMYFIPDGILLQVYKNGFIGFQDTDPLNLYLLTTSQLEPGDYLNITLQFAYKKIAFKSQFGNMQFTINYQSVPAVNQDGIYTLQAPQYDQYTTSTSVEVRLNHNLYGSSRFLSNYIYYSFPQLSLSARTLPQTAGGQYVNFTVLHLGTSGSSILQAFVDFNNHPRQCTDIQQTGIGQFSCVAPQVSFPFNHTFMIKVGQMYLSQVQLEFAPPTITGASISQLELAGQETLVLYGSGFGFCSNKTQSLAQTEGALKKRECATPECYGTTPVGAYCDDIIVSISYGPYVCANAKVLSDDRISCTTVPGIGQGHNLVVTGRDFLSSFTSLVTIKQQTPLVMSYKPPIVYSVSPQNISAQLGDTITVTGANFGLSSGIKVSLKSSKTGDSTELQSGRVQYVSSSQLSFQITTQQQQTFSSSQFQPGIYYIELKLQDVTYPTNYFIRLTKQDPSAPDFTIVKQQGSPASEHSLGPTTDQFQATLQYVIVRSTRNGTLTKANGAAITAPNTVLADSTVNYQASIYYNGNDSFQYQVREFVSGVATGLVSRVGTVSIQVSDKNQAPFVNQLTQTRNVLEDVTSVLKLDYLDYDSAIWNITITVLPLKGTLSDPFKNVSITEVPYIISNVNLEDSYVLYTPILYEFGNNYAAFSWTATDSSGNSLAAQATTLINVAFVNHPPKALPVVAYGIELQDTLIQLVSEEIDKSQVLKYSIKTLPIFGDLYQATAQGTRGAKFLIENQAATSDKVIWGPKPDTFFYGQDNFTFTVSDSIAQDDGVVLVNVEFVNQHPSIVQSSPQALTLTEESTTTSLTVTLVDPDDEQFILIAPIQADRGYWYIDSNKKAFIETGHAISGKSFQLILEHDGQGGAYPYAQLSLQVNDTRKTASKILQVTVAVNCPVGKVNNIWSAGDICVTCPVGALCSSTGAFYPQNQAGYYPLSNSTFLPCVPVDACPAQASTSAFTCADGYTDARCGQCASQYYRSGATCEKCPNYNLSIPVMALIFIAVMSVVLYLVNLLRKIDMGFIGILVTYVQTIAIFKSFNIQWPDAVKTLYSVFSILNLNIELVSPECFIVSPEKSYDTKFQMTMGIPLMLGGTVVVAILLNSICRYFTGQDVNMFIGSLVTNMVNKNGEKKAVLTIPDESVDDVGQNASFAAMLSSVYLLALQLLYLTVAQKSIELYDCNYSEITGLYDFGPEPNRHCYTEPWWNELQPLAILGIVFYVVCIPAVFVLVWKLRSVYLLIKPQDRKYYHNFVLQMTYKKKATFQPEFEYWDSVIMARKLGIILSNLFFVQYKSFQALLLIMILLAGLVVQKKNPYAIKTLNQLENATMLSSIIVMILGLMSYVGGFKAQQQNIFGIIIILTIVGCTFYILFCLFFHFHAMYKMVQARKVYDKTPKDVIESTGLLAKDDPVLEYVEPKPVKSVSLKDMKIKQSALILSADGDIPPNYNSGVAESTVDSGADVDPVESDITQVYQEVKSQPETMTDVQDDKAISEKDLFL